MCTPSRGIQLFASPKGNSLRVLKEVFSSGCWAERIIPMGHRGLLEFSRRYRAALLRQQHVGEERDEANDEAPGGEDAHGGDVRRVDASRSELLARDVVEGLVEWHVGVRQIVAKLLRRYPPLRRRASLLRARLRVDSPW